MIQGLVVVFLSINITIGYVVAGVLFSHLEAETAGSIMGRLLSRLYLVDMFILVSVIAILFFRAAFNLKKLGWLLAALGLVITNGFYLSPLMKQLKSAGVDAQALGIGFSGWHAVSQIIFMLTLALLIIWWFFDYRKTYPTSVD